MDVEEEYMHGGRQLGFFVYGAPQNKAAAQLLAVALKLTRPMRPRPAQMLLSWHAVTKGEVG
jgi:hypothetical protein